MDLKTEISRISSKIQAQAVADYVGDDPERFAAMVNIFLGGPYRVTQRAAWALGICGKDRPWLVAPHLEGLVDNLREGPTDAVKRNTLRVMQGVDIPEPLLGPVAEVGFALLGGQEPVAIKVFAMTVLLNVAKKAPGLRHELRIMVEDQMPYGSPGFLSRGRKVLRELAKIQD